MADEDCSYFQNLTLGGDTDLTSENISFYIYYYTLLFFITGVNIVGNSTVLVVFVRHKRLRCAGNFFIASLAFSDIMMGLAYALYNVSHMELPDIQQVLGSWPICVSVMVAVQTTQLSSSYNLVVVTLNRYLAVTDPAACRHWFSGRKSLCISLLIWACTFSLTALLYISPQKDSYCGMCRYELVWGLDRLVTLTVTTVVIPLLLMSVTYVKLLFVIKRQLKIGCAPTLEETGMKLSKSTKHDVALLKMAGLLLGYFALAWIPTQVFVYISTLCPDCYIDDYIRATVRLLTLSNSAVNVFIYAGRHPDFKEIFSRGFRSHCRCCCCLKSNKINPTVDTEATAIQLKTVADMRCEASHIQGYFPEYKYEVSCADLKGDTECLSIFSDKGVF